jgi:hypothetical protein
MKDEKLEYFMLAVLAGVVAWWLVKGRGEASGVELMKTESAPNYNFNPQSGLNYAPLPQGGTLDINIANQGLGYLDAKYFPLFGFVGMAQGEVYH